MTTLNKKSLKICMIGKAPPIQGGVSRENYFIASALAEMGNQVWLISNALQVETEYRMVIDKNQLKKMQSKKFSNGGSLKVIYTQLPQDVYYIPWANPYVTLLAQKATEIVRNKSCDLIYAYYFEPYGMAAALVSAWTGVPYVVKHAGSDLGSLFLQPGLKGAYVEMLRNSKYILTTPQFQRTFLKEGIPKNRLFFNSEFYTSEKGFEVAGKKLDINGFLKKALYSNKWLHGAYFQLSRKKWKKHVFTIGMCGKIGPEKGNYDLLKAVKILKDQGRNIQLVLLGSSFHSELDRFYDEIEKFGLKDQVWLLPFVTHDKVPEFLRACDLVCFLERGSPIVFHMPVMPKEILDCGRPLLLSGEIGMKYDSNLKHEANVLFCKDPRDIKKLSKLISWGIDNQKKLQEIGLRGREVAEKANVPREDLLSHLQWEFQTLCSPKKKV